MTLPSRAVWAVPARGGNPESVLRPEKVLLKRFRTGVRLPSAPPKQYNPNLLPIGHGFGFIVLMEEIEDW